MRKNKFFSIVLSVVMLVCSFSFSITVSSAEAVQEQRSTMTIQDVLRLSEKGMELTWEDFEQYQPSKVGSSTLYYEYEIGSFILTVKGSDKTAPPTEVILYCRGGSSFDIRYGDIKPFVCVPLLYICYSEPESTGAEVTIFDLCHNVYKVNVNAETAGELSDPANYKYETLQRLIADNEPVGTVNAKTYSLLTEAGNIFDSSKSFRLEECPYSEDDTYTEKVFLVNLSLLFQIADLGEAPLWLNEPNVQQAIDALSDANFIRSSPKAEIEVLPGDANADGDVNIADLVGVQNFLTGRKNTVSNWKNADMDNDGRLTVFDLILLRRTLTKN